MKRVLLISVMCVTFHASQCWADDVGTAVLLPSEHLTIKGGPGTQECSAFKADRDLSPALAKALIGEGAQIVGNSGDAGNFSTMQIALTNFSWECHNKQMTVNISLTASDTGVSGWRKSFNASNTTPFSAIECWTISCASKKWGGVFYPMVEELAANLAKEVLSAHKAEMATKATQPSAPTAPSVSPSADLFDIKEQADKLYAQKSDRSAQRKAYELYTQISKQATNKKLLAEVYDKLDRLEKAGVTTSAQSLEVPESETTGISRSFKFNAR